MQNKYLTIAILTSAISIHHFAEAASVTCEDRYHGRDAIKRLKLLRTGGLIASTWVDTGGYVNVCIEHKTDELSLLAPGEHTQASTTVDPSIRAGGRLTPVATTENLEQIIKWSGADIRNNALTVNEAQELMKATITAPKLTTLRTFCPSEILLKDQTSTYMGGIVTWTTPNPFATTTAPGIYHGQISEEQLVTDATTQGVVILSRPGPTTKATIYYESGQDVACVITN